MTRHIVDHDHSDEAGESRLAHFACRDRAEQPSATAKKAQREERARGVGRIEAFARIDRETS